MKSFAATVVLALLMGIGILANHFFIYRVSDEIKTAVEALPSPTDPACVKEVTDVESLWKKRSSLIHVSVNHIIVDRVGEQLSTLSACAACGDAGGFFTARAKVLDALDDMRRSEDISSIL